MDTFKLNQINRNTYHLKRLSLVSKGIKNKITTIFSRKPFRFDKKKCGFIHSNINQISKSY